MPNYERKPIERILRERKKSRDPAKRDTADELIGDVDLDVPMNAPERTTVKTLGSPEDERSVNGGYGEGNTEGEGFTGRYGKRDTNAGPEGLTTNVMSDVAADDPRVQEQDFSFGAPEPSKPTRESAATSAMFDYDKTQSWSGLGYNYYYEPSPNGGVGTLTAEKTSGDQAGERATINPRTASGQKQKAAWLAIFEERFAMGENPSPTREVGKSKPSRATTDGTEEPSSAEQDEDTPDTSGLGPDDLRPSDTPIDPGKPEEPEEDMYGESPEPADESFVGPTQEPGDYESADPTEATSSLSSWSIDAKRRAAENALGQKEEPEPRKQHPVTGRDYADDEYGPGKRKQTDYGGRVNDAVVAGASQLPETAAGALEGTRVHTSVKPSRVETRREAGKEQISDNVRERAERYAGTPSPADGSQRKQGDYGGRLFNAMGNALSPYRDQEAEEQVLQERRAADAGESPRPPAKGDPIEDLYAHLLGGQSE